MDNLSSNESPIVFVGFGFSGNINDVYWSGIENKDFGEITFDLMYGSRTKLGGGNVKMK